MADFFLVSRRALTEDEYRIFRFHFLLGADWKMCCRRLKMDRGEFFHEVYRIQQKLGQVYRDLQPYALYPLDEYFACTLRKDSKESNLVFFPTPDKRQSVRPPLRKVA